MKNVSVNVMKLHCLTSLNKMKPQRLPSVDYIFSYIFGMCH